MLIRIANTVQRIKCLRFQTFFTSKWTAQQWLHLCNLIWQESVCSWDNLLFFIEFPICAISRISSEHSPKANRCLLQSSPSNSNRQQMKPHKKSKTSIGLWSPHTAFVSTIQKRPANIQVVIKWILRSWKLDRSFDTFILIPCPCFELLASPVRKTQNGSVLFLLFCYNRRFLPCETRNSLWTEHFFAIHQQGDNKKTLIRHLLSQTEKHNLWHLNLKRQCHKYFAESTEWPFSSMLEAATALFAFAHMVCLKFAHDTWLMVLNILCVSLKNTVVPTKFESIACRHFVMDSNCWRSLGIVEMNIKEPAPVAALL